MKAKLPAVESSARMITMERLRLVDEITNLQIEKEDLEHGQLIFSIPDNGSGPREAS